LAHELLFMTIVELEVGDHMTLRFDLKCCICKS
jgi:hypothetical protein